MNTFQAKYLAEKLTLKKSGGNLSRLGNVLAKATIDLNPHQVYAALYAFNSPLSRGAILADEVGLGKTIEAGIIVSQLWTENKRKILILAPASLRTQWQDELLTKFGLDSEVWDGPSFNKTISAGNPVPLTYDGIFITSYNFAYANIGLVQKQNWNVVIIDEAHRFRRVYRGRDASKMAFGIRESIRGVPKVLLTATPLQNSLEELYGIASFIDDKLLGSIYSFRKKFIQPIKENQDIASKRVEQLRSLITGTKSEDGDMLSGIITRTLRKQVTDYVKFTDRKSLTFDFTPSDNEQELYDKVSEYLQRDRLAAIAHTQRNLMILVYRKLLASSSFAIAGTLEKLADNLKQELKYRDGERIVKTETTLDLGFEEEFEDSELEAIEQKRKARVDDSFSDDEIKSELVELQSYHKLALSITENTKGVALLKCLKGIFAEATKNDWPQKSVLFTESTRTQRYLSKILESNGISYTEFNGSNNTERARAAYRQWAKEFPEAASKGSASANVRQALVHEFKTKTQVFVTTEAGSEGLNLQFCNVVINYDLPWNPQRVEQRIGRCHRYGQKYEVIVTNFINTNNYADKRVFELLNEKLKLFDGLFGSSDEILGALENGVDFEKTILEIYQNCKTPKEYDKAFKELQDSISGRIENDIINYRKIILENTDQSVSELFKRTAKESKNILLEQDRDLLRYCQTLYGDKLIYNQHSDDYSLKGYEFPLVFHELRDEEVGVKTRAALDLPFIQDSTAQSLAISTNPIPTIAFNDSIKIAALKGIDHGYILLWKLTIKGVDEQQELVPFVYINKDGKYSPIDVGAADELLINNSVQTTKSEEELPIDYSELMKTWEEWKAPVINKYNKQNERLHDREVDRISTYYDDFTYQIDDKIKKYEEERTEASRKRDNSADLEERRKLQKRMMDIDVLLDKQRILQLKAKTEAAEKRKQDLDELWKKLEPIYQEDLIAMARFVFE